MLSSLGERNFCLGGAASPGSPLESVQRHPIEIQSPSIKFNPLVPTGRYVDHFRHCAILGYS